MIKFLTQQYLAASTPLTDILAAGNIRPCIFARLFCPQSSRLRSCNASIAFNPAGVAAGIQFAIVFIGHIHFHGPLCGRSGNKYRGKSLNDPPFASNPHQSTQKRHDSHHGGTQRNRLFERRPCSRVRGMPRE